MIETKDKFYQYGLTQPYHLSVGAVLFDGDFNICAHHFKTETMPERLRFLSGGLDEYYHLMRETIENGETLTQAVLRGVKEEFGCDAQVDKFLGSTECKVQTPTTVFNKTTVYHAVRRVKLGERTGTDEESKTIIEWLEPRVLLSIFQKQRETTGREELDESLIIERFIEAYGL